MPFRGWTRSNRRIFGWLDLLGEDGQKALVERLVPRAALITPNIPEARALTGLGGDASQQELAAAVVGLGPGAAVVTGGHSAGLGNVF